MSVNNARAESIFTAALGRGPEQRAAYVEGACHDDPELRARVEALLAAHEGLGSFLEPPTRQQPVPSNISEGPGSRIGRYKLLQLIGEGGFGSVFMAEQEEPVKRRVALKVVKLGMDTRQVIARFEAERQALALMDHPNIAKVLDAGATDTGRPYFVMELVKGVPITEYCDKNNLSTGERVELLIAVCNAVQHAHQKGVIHRDIKPSNVLVTLHDGKPVPKVIDFGIAKATSQRLTEKTVFTEYRQFIGTPAYTSPEQAEMSGLDVDTRSDIYSLGVLLYELLTGGTPFDATKLREVAYAEIQRIIREVEPQRPSVRLSTMGDELTIKAKQRSVDPMQLRKQVRGDLDWIVMKCLEKDRTRRYETASGLAADLRRHLHDEPVAAGPPSAAYQFRKLARRNRGLFAAVGAIAAVLILGLGAATTGFVRANHARKSLAQALIDTQRARDEKESQKQEAEHQQHSAEVALSRGMLSEANALDLAGHWSEADARYTQALNAFERLKQPALPVEFSMFGHFAASAPPLMNYALEGRIGAVVFTKDGRRALARNVDRKVFLVDLATGATLRTIELPPNAGIGGLVLSPDETSVVCGGSRKLWKIDLQTGNSLWTQEINGSVALVVRNNAGSQIVFGREDGVFEVRDMQTGRQIQEFHGHASGPPGNSALFTPDGRMVLSSSSSGPVRLWEVDTGKEVRAFADGAPIGGVAMTSDGRLAITASIFRNTEVRVWELQSGTLLRTMHTSVGTIKAVVSPDDRTLVCAGVGGTITFFDLTTGAIVNVLHGKGAITPDLALSADGQMLLSCSFDNYFQLWSTRRNSDVPTIAAREVSDIAISRDGRLGATFGAPHLLSVWNLATGQRLETYDMGLSAEGEMCFSPDGRVLARMTSDGQLKLWDLAAHAPRASWNAHGPPIKERATFCIDFSPDGKTLVSGGSDGLVKLWDAITGKPLRAFSGHSNGVTKVCFTETGGKLASCALDNTARLWDVASGTAIRTLANVPEQQTAMAISANEQSLAIFGSFKLAVYDLQTGNSRRVIFGGPQNGLALSSEGAYVLVAGWDREVRMYDLSTGNQVRGLEGHQGLINMMVTTPQNTAALTASAYDGTVRFWDWRRSGQYVSQLPRVEQAQATLSREPNNAAAWAQLGEWFAFRGMDAWAIEFLEKARKLGAAVPPLTLADCAARLGNMTQSADALRDAVAAASSPQEKSYLGLRLQAIADAAETTAHVANLELAAQTRDQGIAVARKEDFETARTRFARAIALDPLDLWPWYYQGCLLAYLGDESAYEQHCKAMLAQFGSSNDPLVIDRVGKTCLLLAKLGGDPQQLATWVRSSPPSAGYEGWLAICKGMAEYRREDFKAALNWLDHRSLKLNLIGETTLDFYLAMTLQKSGNSQGAKETMQRAEEAFTKVLPLSDATSTNLEDWLICQVAHREAEALLNPSGGSK